MSPSVPTVDAAVHAADPTDVTLADHERQPCEVWTRVMGYHRPVSRFNTGKRGEFAERLHFRERAGAPPAGLR